MRQHLLFFLSLWLGCSLLQAQPCVYLAYEPFDYPVNMPLHGLGGGGGWSSPWFLQNEDDILPGYQIGSDVGSLAYGDLLTSGNHATGGRAYLLAWRQLNATHEGTFQKYVDEWQTGIGTRAEGDTLWVSAVMQVSGDNDHELRLDLFEGSGFWCPECVGVSMGYHGTEANVGGERRWSLRWNDYLLTTDVPVVTGEPALLVLRLIFNQGSTQIDYYVNPVALGGEAPAQPTLSHTSPDPLIIRTAILYMDFQPGSVAIDEIRFADTWRCVAPDVNTPVDLPPVAAFTATPSAGMVPLEVTFDASASYDPDGGALAYFWEFGDGGSPVPGGPIVTHTYTNVAGEVQATLTVRDPSGQENSASQPITLYNEFGAFPCQVSVTCLAMASCDSPDGALRVNTHGNEVDFSLFNAGGQPVPVEEVNHFRHLPTGQYLLVNSGPNGCRDTLFLDIRVDSSTCDGWMPDTCGMRIGTNMEGYADWVPARPLKNLFKHIRADLIPYTADCQCWSLDHVSEDIEIDPNGYPTSIPQTTVEGPTLVRFFLSAEGANVPSGTHAVLRYDGQGSFEMQGGVDIISEAAGRIEFMSRGDMWMNLTASAPGDHVRNIRLTRLADEHADLENDPFYEGFLAKIEPFHSLRFMDWGSTNNNPVVHWEDRTPMTHFTFAGEHGVPYELMIQLCNLTQKDAWVCVPHAADENYIRQMARLFRDQLDPGLTIYLEYSNEVWNWIFTQAHYNEQNRPVNLNYGRAYAEKSGRVFRIWHEEFGGAKDRVQRVLGIQAGFNFLNEDILAQLGPDEWDFGSPTHYVGLTHGHDGVPVLHASSTPEDVLLNALNTFDSFNTYVRQDYRNVQVYGKEVITYEGGQHFVGNVFGIPYDYQEAMWEAQYHPGMYDLYRELHDTIRQWGCRMAMNFSLASQQESVFGSWGVLSDIDQQPPFFETAPKYQALLDMICEMDPTSVQVPLLPSPDEILVWPNPGRGWLQFALPGDEVVRRKMLYNISGLLVWDDPSSVPEISASLPAGWYLLQVFTQEKTYQARVIIVE